jgi:hypothetical protein
MAPHPKLRIQSPRPDILDVVEERKKMRYLEQVCIRVASLLLVTTIFFVFLTIVTRNLVFAFLALCCMLVTYGIQEISQKLRETHESMYLRDVEGAFTV